MPKTLDEIIDLLENNSYEQVDTWQRDQWEAGESKIFPEYKTADAFIFWAITRLRNEATAMQIIESNEILPSFATVLLAESFPDMVLEFKVLHRLGVVHDFER